MLINLLPDFFAVLDSTDRVAAYQRYFEAHRRILEPYWHNYVVDPDGPHFGDVIRATALADRTDLREGGAEPVTRTGAPTAGALDAE